MGKILLIFSFVLLTLTDMNACDVCGCSLSGQNIGILPRFHSQLVGLRYMQSGFQSTHPPLLSTDFGKNSRESFQTLELWGRFSFRERWQLFAFIPITNIQKSEDDQSVHNRGFGDMSLLFMGTIINNKNIGQSSWYHNLQVGGGIKLPTGKNDFIFNDVWIPGLQTGTASWDFFINVNYITKVNDWAVQLESSYRINQQNKNQNFIFGNRWNSSIRLMRNFIVNNSTILPVMGANVEFAFKDKHQNIYNDFSGGYSLFYQFGAEMWFDRMGVGLHGFIPTINNIASGNIVPTFKFNAHISYFF
ncbi:MAG: hypothetical protein WAT79_10470 [Saprospiraceae bacterium]